MRLVADIGGTHARFALVDANGVHCAETLVAADYDSLAAAARHYLAAHQISVKQAAFSVAATLIPGASVIELVNHPAWNFAVPDLAAALQLDDLTLLNDFEALAYGIPGLGPADLTLLCGDAPIAGTAMAVLGPGTGLGMAGITLVGDNPHVVPSEGGNATLPVTDARGFEIIETIRAMENRRHISAEDALSGPGLYRLYRAIAQLAGSTAEHADAAAVAAAAGRCPLAREAVDLFCHWLGIVAGNLALTFQATGGVFIAGGIIPQWGDGFQVARFRDGFIDKGPYRDYLAAIPVYVVTHPYPALEGLRRISL